MNSDTESGTIHIHNVQPGWILVHFTAGNPSPERRFHLLHQAMLKWLSSHLHCRLQNIQPVREHDVLQGLNVFYSVAPPDHSTLTIGVHAEAARQYGSEYLEAVVADAVGIMLTHSQSSSTFAVINRRHVAVVVDRSRDRAYVLHVEKIEAAIPTYARDRLRNWLAHPTSQHYVMDLPEGFEPWDLPPA